jgi:hypothetical protein
MLTKENASLLLTTLQTTTELQLGASTILSQTLNYTADTSKEN